MADVPENQKLWDSLVQQAQARYPSHRVGGLSWPAAKWVREQYQLKGGGYVGSKREVPPQFRDKVKNAKDQKRERENRIKNEKKKRGLL
jgi:hypothetical protein